MRQLLKYPLYFIAYSVKRQHLFPKRTQTVSNIFYLQRACCFHIMITVIPMTIERIDAGKVLILLGKDDMKDFSLDYGTLSFSDPHSRRILSRLLTLACTKTGLTLDNKRMLVEAIPHGSGCLLLLTLREKRRRRFRIKRTHRLLCCVFYDCEALLSACSTLFGRTLPRNRIYLLDGEYILVFKEEALPAYMPEILREFARCVPCRIPAAARVEEYGRDIGELGEIGKYF